MSAQELELIKDRQLFLRNGERSSEVVLVDTDGDGDMYFAFQLKYVEDAKKSQTHIRVIDNHHAALLIETAPETVTKPIAPIKIGKYGADKKDLYISFVIEPRMTTNGEHHVNISFYAGKEVGDVNG